MENREIQQVSDNTELELTKVLTMAETDFGLSKVLQQYGISENESITVEFRYGDGILLSSQTRHVDSSNTQCCWAKTEKQVSISQKELQISENVGQELVEVLNQADILSSIKNVLQSQRISEDETITIDFGLSSAVTFSSLTKLKCPCPHDPRRCCKVG